MLRAVVVMAEVMVVVAGHWWWSGGGSVEVVWRRQGGRGCRHGSGCGRQKWVLSCSGANQLLGISAPTKSLQDRW